jgi:hypothetical protein
LRHDGAVHYCVSTATLVSPRTTPVESLNWTKMRLSAASKGMAPLAVPKMEKVGVALVAMVVVTLAAGLAKHCPVCGFVSHRVGASGRVAAPVLAVAVIDDAAPRLTVATDDA